jgi:hypothetical protein
MTLAELYPTGTPLSEVHSSFTGMLYAEWQTLYQPARVTEQANELRRKPDWAKTRAERPVEQAEPGSRRKSGGEPLFDAR